jgi:hypothetical protein
MLMATAPARPNIDIGRVVGNGFKTLGRNFPAFFAVSLILAGLPSFFVSYYLYSVLDAAESTVDINEFDWTLVVNYLVGLLVSLIASFVLQGILIRSAILHLSGRPVEIGASISLALRMLFPIIGLSIVVTILVGIGFVMLIVPGVMIYIAFIVSVPALIEERRGIFGSMRRSRDLTRGSRWQIFILVVFFYIVSAVSSAVIGMIFGVDPVSGLARDPMLGGVAGGLSSSLVTTVIAVLLASLYVELRTVKEGTQPNDLADIFG